MYKILLGILKKKKPLLISVKRDSSVTTELQGPI